MRSPESLEDDNLDPKILPGPFTRKIGEIGRGCYDIYICIYICMYICINMYI
jgi:hypothetical protein